MMRYEAMPVKHTDRRLFYIRDNKLHQPVKLGRKTTGPTWYCESATFALSVARDYNASVNA